MTSLLRSTDYHKNAMNKLISRLMARYDINNCVSIAALRCWMEHLHDCCVCKKRLPDRKKRIPLFGQTGEAKDIRKGLVLSFPMQNSKTASICLGLTFSYPIFEALHELRQKALSSVGLTLLAHGTVNFHFGYVIN